VVSFVQSNCRLRLRQKIDDICTEGGEATGIAFLPVVTVSYVRRLRIRAKLSYETSRPLIIPLVDYRMGTITTRGGITGIVSCEPREHGFVGCTLLLLLPKASVAQRIGRIGSISHYKLIAKFRTLISSLGLLISCIS